MMAVKFWGTDIITARCIRVINRSMPIMYIYIKGNILLGPIMQQNL